MKMENRKSFAIGFGGLITVFLLCSLACGAVSNKSNARAQILFGDFVAQDQSFTGLVPFNWKIQSATQRHFLVTNLQNEKVWVDVWDVPMDAQSLANIGQLNPLSTSLRIYSPPLAPVDVLKQLYPPFAQGAVQNLNVLMGKTVPASVGMQAGVFDYRYLLHGQTRYEGEMLIITVPPTHSPYVNYWSLITCGGEAPAEIFQQNKALYAVILGSLKYNQQVLSQNAREPFDRMWENDPEYRKRMDDFLESLGTGYPFEESNGARHTIYGPSPLPIGPGERPWYCGYNDYRISGLKPDFGCVPLQQVVH
jgi:hypothetical protein